MNLINYITPYLRLTRLDKPIGISLLLWPTLWALWLASGGYPHVYIVIIFVAGVILMRSAGCIANDFADRFVDGGVKRTKDRPLASGQVSTQSALLLMCVLSLCAFALVLFCNALTIGLAFAGMLITLIYPYLKRVTHLPQLGLGVAFAWGIPMAFAAETHSLPAEMWIVFLPGIVWPVIYDTFYAMVDRDDDVNVGIKSAAILFGSKDRLITAMLQLVFLLLLALVGLVFKLNFYYYISLFIAAIFCIYQQWLIRYRDRQACFKAFLNNHWVGLVIFIGIILGYQ